MAMSRLFTCWAGLFAFPHNLLCLALLIIYTFFINIFCLFIDTKKKWEKEKGKGGNEVRGE